MRKYTALNQDWLFTQDGQTKNIDLPHSWNAMDGQDGGDDYYRGTCIYSKRISYMPQQGNRLFLEFRGVASEAEVAVNGACLCRHEGGYSAFRVDVTEHWKGENTIEVTVSNTPNDYVYPQKADFTFYGGIYRDVYLVEVPASHFALEQDGTPGITVDARVEETAAQVTVRAEVVGQCDAVRIRIGDLAQEVVAVDGIATARASRGAVTKEVKRTEAMERMLYRNTVIGLIKQAGGAITEEMALELNRKLRQIPKQDFHKKE